MVDRSIEWFCPQFGVEEEHALVEVLRSGFVNDGPITRAFEKQIAQLVGVNYCVAVTSGTAAISMALMAAGIGPGDEVLVPDLTFIATANAVRLTGASVRLVDIEPTRLGIDPDKLAEAIGPQTCAVVTVDVNGRGADYKRIEPLCRAKGLKLITDSAEALGSQYAGKPLGSFGDAGCFSFSPNKLITTGQGGMVATNDVHLFERLVELKDQGRRQRGTGGDDPHPVLGFNYKFTDIQAALGLTQLNRLAIRAKRARERDAWYREEIEGSPGVAFLGGGSDPAEELRAWTDVLFVRRDNIRRELDASGIGNRAFWHPLHTQGTYMTQQELFPVATTVSARGLWLASTFDITKADVARICEVIRGVIADGR